MNNQLTNAVTVSNGQVATSSLKIAEIFDKEHKNVIRDIESLQVPDEWYKLNFEPIQNPVDLGMGRTRMDKAYSITRDGFTILAMGFTGAKAMQFKIAYIEAFNRMEAELQGRKIQPELPATESGWFTWGEIPVIAARTLAGQLGITLPLLHRLSCKFTDRTDVYRVKSFNSRDIAFARKCGVELHPHGHAINLFTKTGAEKLRNLSAPYFRHALPESTAPAPAPIVTRMNPEAGQQIFQLTMRDIDFTSPQRLEVENLLRRMLEAGFDVSREFSEVKFMIHAISSFNSIMDHATNGIKTAYEAIDQLSQRMPDFTVSTTIGPEGPRTTRSEFQKTQNS